MSKLVCHLESFLGKTNCAWAGIPGLQEIGVQIGQYDSAPFGVPLALSTLGLSLHPLRSASSGEIIFHELLMFASEPCEPLNIPAILAQIASGTVRRKRPLLRGDVVGPQGGGLLEKSSMEAFFVTLPILLPPEFAAAEDEEGRGIALAWLIPISAKEAAWARSQGWEAFEEALDKQNPELLNWYRDEMRLQ